MLHIRLSLFATSLNYLHESTTIADRRALYAPLLMLLRPQISFTTLRDFFSYFSLAFHFLSFDLIIFGNNYELCLELSLLDCRFFVPLTIAVNSCSPSFTAPTRTTTVSTLAFSDSVPSDSAFATNRAVASSVSLHVLCSACKSSHAVFNCCFRI